MQTATAPGVFEAPAPAERTRPRFYYREDLKNVHSVVGLIIQMIASLVLSSLGGIAICGLIRLVVMLFPLEVATDNRMSEMIWDSWPIAAASVMWMFLNVFEHVDMGSGAYGTLIFFRGNQLGKFRFSGEVSVFSWIEVRKHNYGGNTVEIECPSAFVRVAPGSIDSVEVFSEGDRPPRLIFSMISLNPFQAVRRIDQADENVSLENLNEVAESVLKEALQHENMNLQVLMTSHELEKTMNDVFKNLKDGEGRPRCYLMDVNGRDEWVIDTGYGFGIYNVQAQDIGPSKAIRDALSRKRVNVIDAEGKAESFKATMGRIKELKIEDPYLSLELVAMILNENLSGDEIKMWLGNLSFGRGGGTNLLSSLKEAGFKPEQIERIVSSVSQGAQAVASAFEGRQGGKKSGDRKKR